MIDISLLSKEMNRLCGIENGILQYSVHGDKLDLRFEHEGHFVTITDLHLKALELPIKEFSKRHLRPASLVFIDRHPRSQHGTGN